MGPSRLLQMPLAAGLLALLFNATGNGLSLGQLDRRAPSLLQREPIEQLDQRLRGQGWRADGDPALDSYDRELAGNDLASLRSCSGTGAGFCRYDYRRGPQQLSVITIPNTNGDGLVHHWQLDGSSASRP